MNRRSLNGVITLGGKQYHIVRELGRGGSCIAYRATASGQPRTYDVVIKELYPADLADDLTFGYPGGFDVSEEGRDELDMAKERFLTAAKKQVAFFADDSNHSIGVPEIHMRYNTVYSVLPLTNGVVLSEAPTRLSLCEIAQIMASLCNAVGSIHRQGRLYLDIKPDNIYLFDADSRETRRAALFDFDTVVANDKEALWTARPFVSNGWQPPELTSWRTDSISERTDYYSIGAVFYWLLSGQAVSNPVLDAMLRREYDGLGITALTEGKRNAARITETILFSTLRRSVGDRITSMEGLREMFTELDKSSETAAENKPISDKIDELTEALKERKVAPQIVMTQHGSNNVQIGSISGGELNISFGSPGGGTRQP